MQLDGVALLWLIVTPLVFSLTWTAIYTHYFIAMLPGGFLLIGIAGADLWQVLQPRRLAQHVLTIAGGVGLIGIAALQIWLLVALLLFVDSHDTPGGFGTPLHYFMTMRQAILAQHPPAVLARLDGQYIGYNSDTTVWRTLLYEVPSVRFLDAQTEVYPAQPVLYLSRDCSGAPGEVYLRPPGEGCYATMTRTPDQLDRSRFTPFERSARIPALTFANGARLIGYRWQPARFSADPACLTLLWAVDANPQPADYLFAVHFSNDAGQEIAFADGLSWRGVYWQPGDQVVRRFCLADKTRVAAISGVNIGMYRFADNADTQFDNMNLIDEHGAAVGQTVSVSFPRTLSF